MSKQIDERVVEMRFDNSQFEKNAATTMSTLEKLKQSLNLTGAAKGFEDIGSAVKKVDMTGLGNSAETVGLKFNALYTIADQTFRRMTDSALNTAKRIASAFTIDPIKTGFQEYETQMGAIQTILANTSHQGTTLADVNAALDELNKYADMTIYNFTEMTRNIGTFTAAGLDLDTSTRAIQGIANLAAVSGSTSQQASTAMYQLSQALSAGVIRLQDWNSVVNAGMGGKVFQDAIIETAKNFESVDDALIKAYESGTNFRALLDASDYGQWFSSDILAQTLKKFTKTGVIEYLSETHKVSAESLTELQALGDEVGYTSESFKEMALSIADGDAELSKVIRSALTMADTATRAATEVKTFSQLMDTLKEGVQSGWSQTWRIIIGDFEQAKELFTSISDTIGGFIGKMSDHRNALLGGAFKSNWDKINDALTEAKISSDDFDASLRKVLKSHGKDAEELILDYGSLEEAFRKSEWGADYLKEALDDLNSEIVDLSGVKEGLKFGSTGDDVKKIQQALKDAGYQCGEFGDELNGVDGIIGEVTTNSIKAFQKAKGLAETGIIDADTLKALEEANSQTAKLKKEVYDLIPGIDKLGGREKIIEAFKNIFKALGDILKAVRKAWDNVFDKFTSSDLYNVIDRFHEFTKTLVVNEDVANNITSTFEGLFSVLKFIKDVIVTVISVGAKLIWTVFKPLAKVLLSVTSAAGKLIKSGGNMLSKVFEPMGDVVSSVIGFIGKLADVIATFVSNSINKLSELEIFQTIGQWFSDAGTSISNALKDIAAYIDKIDLSNITVGFGKIQNFFDPIVESWKSFKGSEEGMLLVENLTAPFKALWEWITGFKLPKFNFEKVAATLNKFFSFLKNNSYTGIVGGLKGTFEYLRNQLTYKWNALVNNSLTKFSDFYLQYGDSIKAGFDKCKEVVAAIIQFIFGTKNLTVGDILDLAEKFLTVAILIKTLNIVKDISGSLDSIADAFENIGAGIKWRAIGAAFLSLGVALGAFAICLKIVESMDAEAASRSARILLTALTVMGLIVGGLLVLGSKLSGNINLLTTTASLLAISLSLIALVYVLKQIDGNEFNNLGKSFSILVGVLMSLMLTMTVLGKTAGAVNLGTVAALLTFITALKQILEVLDLYSKHDFTGQIDDIFKIAGILLGLALIVKIASSGVKAGASTAGLALLVLSIVVSLKILIDVIAEFGKMPVEQLKQGISVMMVVLTGITAMLAAINLTSKVTKVDKGQKGITGFAGLAAALFSVAIAIAILGSLPIDTLKQGGVAVTVVLGLFTAMLSILGKSMRGTTQFGKITGMIIGMGVIIAELALIMYLLRDLDGTDALAKFGSISMVLVAMAGCLRTLTKHTNGAKNIYKWIGAMAAFSLVVVALGGMLWLLKDVDGVNGIAQFAAISLILFVMGETLEKLTAHYRIKPENITKWIIAMGAFTLLVGALGGVLWLIKDVDGSNAVAQFAAISMTLIAMSACIKILSTIGPAASAAIPALGVLALFAAGLTAFLAALGGIDALTKGGFSDVMTRAVDIMTKIGEALGGLVGGVLGGIGKGLTAALPQMGEDLSDFMEAASVFFAGLKSIDASTVTNTGFVVAAIGELGALASLNGIDNFFSKGRSLPNLGTDLSNFMTNASGFFNGLSSIDTGMATAVKSIAEAVGILADASFTDQFTFGDGFASLGEKLVPFGESMVAFSKTISGKIDTTAVEAAASAAGVITELNTKLPKEYGPISGLFKSEPIPLDTFGEQLVLFGKAFVSFSNTVSQGEINSEAIEAAANAAGIMAELNTKLPKEYGGLSGLFKSEPIPLDTFGSQLVLFGRAIMSFSTIVSQGNIDTVAVEAAASAGGIMAELGKSLPTEYGAIAALFKDQPVPMDTFGAQMVMFGRAIAGFSNTVKGKIDQGAVEAAATAGTIMSEMAKSLPDDPSIFDKWFGSDNTMSMEDFGKQLVEFGEAVIDFSESVSGNLDITAIKTAVSVATDMVKMASSLPEDINLTVLKTGLIDLGEAMCAFSESVSGNVDNETITVVLTAAKTLAEAANIMPDQVNLANLTIGLSDFGTAIVSFSEQVSGAVDGGSVTAAATAGKDIATMLATIPQGIDPTTFIDNLGRLGQALVEFSNRVAGSESSPGINTAAMYTAQVACDYLGNMLTSLSVYSDLTDFINNAALLAQAIVDFSTRVSAEGAVNSEAISTASAAGTQIGNMISSIAVYTDLTEFVNNAALLAQAIVDFSAKVSGEGAINIQAIANATAAGTQIANLIVSIPAYSDISNFIDNAISLAQAIIDFSSKVSSGINTTAIDTAATAANKIKNIVTTLGSVTGVSDVVATINELSTTITTFATTLAEADVTGMSEDSANFKRIVESFGDLSKSGVETFIKNLSNSRGKITTAVNTFCNSILSSTRTYKTSFRTVGGDLVTGFANGITANTFKARAAAAAMASAALTSAKAALGINSPSKEFYAIGLGIGEGLTSGVAASEIATTKSVNSLAKSALVGFGDAISMAKDMVENGIDAQPTIRPVLDLSGITADASKISSLFDFNAPIGVMANVSAISRGMSGSQNGSTNDDVINAINGLRDTFNQKTGDTYTIGNITYDDGSEVSNAIKTLVRAARVERRT